MSKPIDLYIRMHDPENLPYEQQRLRYAPGDVVDWLEADDSNPTRCGVRVLNDPEWRIVRVTNLTPTEAAMLCSPDVTTHEDAMSGVQCRRRLWTLPLELVPKVRNTKRTTVYDVLLDSSDLMEKAILRPEEKRCPFTNRPLPNDG